MVPAGVGDARQSVKIARMTRAKTDVECMLKSALMTGEAAVKRIFKGVRVSFWSVWRNLNLKSGKQFDSRTTVKFSLDTRKAMGCFIDLRALRTGHAPQSKNHHDVDKRDTGFVGAAQRAKFHI